MKNPRYHASQPTRSIALAACIVAGMCVAIFPQAPAAGPDSAQVIQFLTQTVDWYRRVGSDQQIATAQNTVAVGNDNRQMADHIVRLAFDFARAEADVIDKQHTSGGAQSQDSGRDHALLQLEARLDKQTQDAQSELGSLRHKSETASGKKKQELQSQIAEVQAELDLANARKDSIHNMVEFASQTSGSNSHVGGLHAQIQTLADTLPTALTAPSNSTEAAYSSKQQQDQKSVTSVENTTSPSGIWDLSADLFALSQDIRKVDSAKQQTGALANRSKELRAPLSNQLRGMSRQGDELAKAADTANVDQLGQLKTQIDNLAVEFKQDSAAALPLSKQAILLELYQSSLANWESILRARRAADLKGLVVRLAFLALFLGIVVGASELWRRAVYRYIHEPRRRYQFLLLRRFAMWFLIAVIVAFAFASKLGSVVTFAGLITAGVAVALQNVILSVVGYFFLIGKYGIRIGDRVQIGGVTGEVVDIGLVRLHLMELSGGDYLPSGRVVAFSNSIVFQPTAGLFKQIPGTNFQWREITFDLSRETDYASAKKRLLGAIERVLADYRDDLERQYRVIQSNFILTSTSGFRPQVQARLTPNALQVLIRYAVDRRQASDIDERVTRELLQELDREPKLHFADSTSPGVTVKTDLAA
jgi:small-conductance mechanosensitive channel